MAFLRNSDDFVFDQEIFAQALARGARVAEIPIPTRYFAGASSVDFPTSVRYGLSTLAVLIRFRLDRRPRARWALLRRPAAGLAAAARGADLLVLGSHGHSRISHAVLGSVADETIRAAECPVVVIPSHLIAQQETAAESAAVA
jgi:hypothetical protein